ncbi:unnamed protein product [Amoebophrya sp. A120]|nr:unnamed protein product [Amoebophrya sp. A120]|eukprot:GSA120T00007179001.1
MPAHIRNDNISKDLHLRFGSCKISHGPAPHKNGHMAGGEGQQERAQYAPTSISGPHNRTVRTEPFYDLTAEVVKARQTNGGLKFLSLRNAEILFHDAGWKHEDPVSEQAEPHEEPVATRRRVEIARKCQLTVWNALSTEQERCLNRAPGSAGIGVNKKIGVRISARNCTLDPYAGARPLPVPVRGTAGGSERGKQSSTTLDGACFLMQDPQKDLEVLVLTEQAEAPTAAPVEKCARRQHLTTNTNDTSERPADNFTCAGCRVQAERGSRFGAGDSEFGEEDFAQPRFHFVPDNVRWGSSLRRLHLQAYNVLPTACIPSAERCLSRSPRKDIVRPAVVLPHCEFCRPQLGKIICSDSGGTAADVERPFGRSSAKKPILLPTTDAAAVWIATNQKALRENDWRVLTAESASLIETLADKKKFLAHAKCLLSKEEYAKSFPRQYGSIDELGKERLRMKTGVVSSCDWRDKDSNSSPRLNGGDHAPVTFPIILKPSRGQFGRGAKLLRNWEDVARVEEQARTAAAAAAKAVKSGNPPVDAPDSTTAENHQYVLQEYTVGSKERSTSLLVEKGKILDSITCEYTYAVGGGTTTRPSARTSGGGKNQDTCTNGGSSSCAREERTDRNSDDTSHYYIWPLHGVKESEPRKFSPHEELDSFAVHVFEKLLTTGFSGICNFNYKVVTDADTSVAGTNTNKETGKIKATPRDKVPLQLRIFECNPRPGGDLIQDVPRQHAIRLLEKLERMGTPS